MMTIIRRLIDAIEREGLGEFVANFPRFYFTKNKFKKSPVSLYHRGKSIEIHHRKTHDDLLGIWQCFRLSQYEIPKPLLCDPFHRNAVDALYQDWTSRGKIPLILDCGANIGAGSLWFLSRYPRAHIVAVEPNPSNLRMLRQNLANKPVDIIDGAVAGEDQTLTFVDTGSTLANQIVTGAQEDKSTYQVQGYALRSVMEKCTRPSVPFILKIDIEGAERLLFESDDDVAKNFPVMILEPHDFMMPGKAVSANFLKLHSDLKRDFLFWEENIFSIDPSVFSQTVDARCPSEAPFRSSPAP